KHFWHFYPRVNGAISTEPNKLIQDKRKIFNWLKCKAEDFPPPEQLLPVKFDNSIFEVLDRTVCNLMAYFKKQQTSRQVKDKLSKPLEKVHYALTQVSPSPEDPIYQEAKERVLKAIATVNLRIYDCDIKGIWEKYVSSRDLNALVFSLDEFFVEQDQYYNLAQEDLKPLEMIKEEDIQLVCYQWFNPE
ncbi:MAG TPA: helicase, partial [Cyanobacteria bacterium UBA11372]|nr:helicase [Cyanobacteria bacterium UBA11372]